MLLCGLPGPASASEPADERLLRLERALEDGRSRQQGLEAAALDLRREVSDLRHSLVSAAAEAQRRGDAVSELERRLADLNARMAAMRTDLADRRGELAATLGALQRLSLQPPEALIASPASALDTVRSSLLLGSVVPELEARAKRLGHEMAALSRLGQEIGTRKGELALAAQALERQRRALDELLERKAALVRRTEAESAQERRRLERLAGQAESLRALIAKLEAEPAPPPSDEARLAPSQGPLAALPPVHIRPFSAARGAMSLPARGAITRRFGQATEFGAAARGITILTRPSAPVVSPYDGRIVFAGSYRGYGQLLIIEHGEGYHTLIAGLSRIDGVVGQWLLAGEPIGRMGEDSGAKPALYVEFRRNGEPIDPLPWLTASQRKVSG